MYMFIYRYIYIMCRHVHMCLGDSIPVKRYCDHNNINFLIRKTFNWVAHLEFQRLNPLSSY